MDRFYAIIYTYHYERYMTQRRAVGVIITCWVLAVLVGGLPLVGWNKGRWRSALRCSFTNVITLKYLTCLFFVTMVAPFILLACVYLKILSEVRKQVDTVVFYCQEISSKKKVSLKKTYL